MVWLWLALNLNINWIDPFQQWSWTKLLNKQHTIPQPKEIIEKMRNKVSEIYLERVTKLFIRLWDTKEPQWDLLYPNAESSWKWQVCKNSSKRAHQQFNQELSEKPINYSKWNSVNLVFMISPLEIDKNATWMLRSWNQISLILLL